MPLLQLIDPCLEVVREADWGGIVGVYAHSSTWVIPEGEDEGKQGYWEYDPWVFSDFVPQDWPFVSCTSRGHSHSHSWLFLRQRGFMLAAAAG